MTEEERKDESPSSWRLGLRKTGSYGALAEITATKEAQKEKDTTGVMRSASSPRLSSSLDNKDKEKVNSHIIESFNIIRSIYHAWYVHELGLCESLISIAKNILGYCSLYLRTLQQMITNISPVRSSVSRKRIKGPDLPTWPPPSPGDWPVLQTLTRRKTGEALGPSGSVQTCIGMSGTCCPLLCVAGNTMLCMLCVALSCRLWLGCYGFGRPQIC